ncbi:MAG TPA: FAD-dependent oxidoreductase, partial [Methylomirabilota bacterium]|nr:FAD-dependent oxidoreductase [Methylomirabilota bacterium]
MPTRHLVIGGGTAGLNAIRTIREEDGGASDITLVSAERPYSRMVLPYYLGRTIAESHVFTATPASLAAWKVKTLLGRKAAGLDPAKRTLTLEDGAKLEYDDCLIATGSRAAKPPIPGADGPHVHCFWTLDEARAVIAGVTPGARVVMVGAGFIAFTILNAILSREAKLTIVEVAPRILPRMVDAACAGIVQRWLEQQGVAIRTGATLTRIEQIRGKRKLHFRKGEALTADVVIMATGIRTNLEWLKGSGLEMADDGQGGILVDDHLRANVKTVYAAGDVARGRNLVTGAAEVHAIEPTAQEHGRVVGANMAGRDVAYRGSLLMNIVEVCHLDVASFGEWDDAKAEVYTAIRPGQFQYRKLLFHDGRLTGALICGPANDIWTTNDVGMLKGLVYSGVDLSAWKAHLKANPFDIKPAFIALHTTSRLLPQTILGRPSQSPQLP